jgi:hypothetical protein
MAAGEVPVAQLPLLWNGNRPAVRQALEFLERCAVGLSMYLHALPHGASAGFPAFGAAYANAATLSVLIVHFVVENLGGYLVCLDSPDAVFHVPPSPSSESAGGSPSFLAAAAHMGPFPVDSDPE